MPEPTLDEFLQAYPETIRALVMQTRALILRVMPDAIEMVDPPSKIVAYGFSRTYAGLVCAIAPFAGHVNLMFSRGAQLADPHGLLKGAGKRARHLKITALEDLQHPAAQALLEEALRLHAD
jgi:hypothetical protein